MLRLDIDRLAQIHAKDSPHCLQEVVKVIIGAFDFVKNTGTNAMIPSFNYYIMNSLVLPCMHIIATPR